MKIKSFAVIVATCTILCHWDAFGCSEGSFMKQIHLGGKHGSVIGNYALVDDTDYEWLNQCRWWAQKGRWAVYAVRKEKQGGRWVHIRMHRIILGLTDPKAFGDHEDGNGLNNQRYNIRSCTIAENNMNTTRKSLGTSRYKGVSHKRRGNKWTARIGVGGKIVYLGDYTTQEEAALAYNAAATKFHGRFASPNIITN